MTARNHTARGHRAASIRAGIIVALWTAAAQGMPAAYAAEAPAGPSRNAYGHPAPADQPARIIVIAPGQRYVNVTNGETILFRVNGRSFAWTFRTSVRHRSFELSEVAPVDVDVRGIRVYCVPDLYERAG